MERYAKKHLHCVMRHICDEPLPIDYAAIVLFYLY